MENPSSCQDDEDARLNKLVKDYFDQGQHIKALELIEDSISSCAAEKLSGSLHCLQGSILFDQAYKPKNSDTKLAFLLGSVECFMVDSEIHAFAAIALFELGKLLCSAFYYRKALKDAKTTLSLLASSDRSNFLSDTKKLLEKLIEEAESKILLVKNSEPMFRESEEVIRSDSDSVAGKRLRSYWAGMNVESKRDFLKVSTAKLTSYADRLYGREGQDAFETVLDSARINRKWKFWMCRTCSQKFFYPKKFKNHLEQEHAAKFKPSKTKHMAQRVDKVWAGMISVAGWEPLDAAAAAEMIKTRLEFVKAFVYENGWSKDWPLAADVERSKLLREIQLLLVSFWERKILSCGIRDWMMRFPVKHLEQFEISEHILTTECCLVETPQSLCFLERDELNQILHLLKLIKCERDDDIDLICKAVDSLWGRTRVKEKIEFDHQSSSLLLDKRLLRGKIATFDDEGTVGVCDPDVYYAKTHPQGDDIITWLLDCPLEDENFELPRSIRAYNLDIWVAVLRSIHFTCRTLETKYEKKLQILGYDEGLIDAINLCVCEDERRRSIPEHQWNKYASLLGHACEERLTRDGDSLSIRIFFCVVRDVLEGASRLTLDFLDPKDYLNLIHGHKNLSDDIVLKSIDLLRSVVANKLPLVDSKILLVENSRISLLDDLTRLSIFDYRSYILHLLKRFLREELDGIVDMDAKAKVAAAEADLLSELEQKKEKNPDSKKHRRIKKTSPSISSPRYQNVKDESSLDVEPGVASPSLKAVEECSMEPEDTLSSKKDGLEPKDTDNQEEAVKDMQNMPREYPLSEHVESALGESAVRCNSALNMTLKALCKIKILKEYLVRNRHQFAENLEEQVPCALQNFFAAFVSKQIKEEGLYSYFLGNLLASLQEVDFMSSDAAELLVSILEFWPCWKSPEIESLVTRLFKLEEYERMSCSRCRMKPNYPEQSSYGIVMAADSIRDLKYAFRNIKFEDILKVIRLEDKMLCDIKTGGCGKANFVHHVISSTCPPIFTIVLVWEKDDTEKEIAETTKALEWEIDISRLYEGLEPNTKYRLVSMVGCSEEEEYICLAYRKNRWVSLRQEALGKKVVGSWKNVVRFCRERKVRPEILFYEAAYCSRR